MTSPTSERLQFVLDTVNGGAVVNELQRIGAAGENSQTRLQQRVGETEKAFDAQGRAGGTSLAVISDGANRSTSMLGRMSDRLGVTESTLRTGIATAAAVGFGMLIAKAAEAVNAYVDLAGEVRTFQRASGAGAEESSKFVAVLDDLQISADTGSAALGKLARVDPGKLATYGIEVARANDGTVSLTETLLNVADAYAATEDPQQRALLGNAAFGRSYQTLIPLLEQGRAGLQSYFDGVSDGQILTQAQLDQTRQYELALDDFQDALGDVSRAAGEKLVPALTSVLEVGAGVIEVFGAIPGPLVQAAVSATAFAFAAGAITRGLNSIRAARAAETTAQTAASISTLGAAASTAEPPTTRLGRAMGGLNRGAAGAAAVGAVVPILGDLIKSLRSAVVEEPDITRLSTALENLGATGRSGGAFADMGGIEGFNESLLETIALNDTLDNGLFKATGLTSGFKWFNQATEDIQSMDEALADSVKSGNADAAAAAWDRLAAAAEAQGIPIERLREQFPEYAEAVEDAALADETGTAAAEGHAGAMEEARDKASKYTDAVNELTKGLEVLNGGTISLAEADIALRDSMADFTDQVRENVAAGDENALSLDRNVQAGRDNESALLDQIAAAQDYAAAVAEQTGSTKGAEKAFQSQINAIRDNMIALGFNRDQVIALIGQYARVPGQVLTNVNLNDYATPQIRSVKQLLKELDGSSAEVAITSRIFAGASTSGTPKGKAVGGAVEANTDYVVGEVRPELFRSATAGTIVPNTGPAGSGPRSGRDVPLVNIENATIRDERDIYTLADELAWTLR